ncbi:hypothetical protein CC78DRAFT_578270 [Lojkania enalia]|uniref:Uncharacterized protein n=1 Tax=Lojkania enalia TaxID=147567 RepID=A0A9P4KBK6_9PLEO|nr:hypothetical protein CC78DRAFT_578270 [Didymosphaeria enalia]
MKPPVWGSNSVSSNNTLRVKLGDEVARHEVVITRIKLVDENRSTMNAATSVRRINTWINTHKGARPLCKRPPPPKVAVTKSRSTINSGSEPSILTFSVACVKARASNSLEMYRKLLTVPAKLERAECSGSAKHQSLSLTGLWVVQESKGEEFKYTIRYLELDFEVYHPRKLSLTLVPRELYLADPL